MEPPLRTRLLAERIALILGRRAFPDRLKPRKSPVAFQKRLGFCHRVLPLFNTKRSRVCTPISGSSRLSPSVLLAEKLQDPSVDLRRLLNEHEMANSIDPVDLGVRSEESRHALSCLHVEGDATILGTMQIKGGLRD